jgi:hypothetical protein
MTQEKFGHLIFPSGTGGNHLRWLLFLDDRFYNPFGGQSLGEKIEFIKTNVYANRSWNTWLEVEWKYRNQLDPILTVHHLIPYLTPWDKVLFLRSENPLTAATHYMHINLGINSQTPDLLVKQIIQFNLDYIKVIDVPNSQNKKAIKCDSMFAPVLDKAFYQEVIEFYGFSDNYNAAQKIHSMHHQCRVNSARDFYNYFTGDQFSQHLENLRILGDLAV